ncbi:CCC motif membrane protein [Mesonia aestuariivivens]|uniref:DUF5362 domain-containing protein n=1 Tax=Mesonia aestuariivivens TaxID=2796128 RepID=A0ABS6VXM1_9FLAO|nr:CCC motif membrane protein [Mesonia aestuariivivens]MBW2960337.1 hypothetical protein [Mesonia aestuariivivens]
MNNNKLPADSSAMTLGIIALVIVVVGCCCGLLTYVALILSIIGLISANKSLSLYRLQPEIYDPISVSNVNNAKIVNMVAIVLSGIISLSYSIYFIIYGALFSTMLFGLYDNYQELGEFDNWDQDSIYQDETYKYEVEEYDESTNLEDTLVLDSLEF